MEYLKSRCVWWTYFCLQLEDIPFPQELFWMILNLLSSSSYPFSPSVPLTHYHCSLILLFHLFITDWRTFRIFPQGHHWSPPKTSSPTLPNQFASKTNIVFNQIQLDLQVKIFSQLKLIRPIMSLGESGVTTLAQAAHSSQISVHVSSCSPCELFITGWYRGHEVQALFIYFWLFQYTVAVPF